MRHVALLVLIACCSCRSGSDAEPPGCSPAFDPDGPSWTEWRDPSFRDPRDAAAPPTTLVIRLSKREDGALDVFVQGGPVTRSATAFAFELSRCPMTACAVDAEAFECDVPDVRRGLQHLAAVLDGDVLRGTLEIGGVPGPFTARR